MIIKIHSPKDVYSDNYAVVLLNNSLTMITNLNRFRKKFITKRLVLPGIDILNPIPY